MNYKLSSFLVFSDPIINNKYVLAYSTHKTNLQLIAIDLYNDLINNINKIDSESFKYLVDNGILVNKDTDELKNIISENNKSIKNNSQLYQVISPSANCQLGCDYCGQTHTKDTLDNKLNTKILNRIKNNLNKSNYKSLFIGWFGSEPLMGLNNIRKLSNSLIKLSEELNIRYSAKIVTNGLSLKKEIFYELYNKYKVYEFEITLDGTQEHHDIRRFTKKKEKTFEIILKNLSEIILDERFDSKKMKINIRSNVDKQNHKSIKNLIDILKNRSILQHVSFYTAPIHSWGNDAHLTSLSILDYADFQLDTLMYLLKNKKNVNFLPGKTTNIVCTSLHNDAEVFDAYGDVYNCTEISQVNVYKDSNYKISNLNSDKSDLNQRSFNDWNTKIQLGDEQCSTCKILPICGGSCPKLWSEGISPCPAIKYNIKDRMVLEFYKKMTLNNSLKSKTHN